VERRSNRLETSRRPGAAAHDLLFLRSWNTPRLFVNGRQ
jgi:hypothetical protein